MTDVMTQAAFEHDARMLLGELVNDVRDQMTTLTLLLDECTTEQAASETGQTLSEIRDFLKGAEILARGRLQGLKPDSEMTEPESVLHHLLSELDCMKDVIRIALTTKGGFIGPVAG
jgi:hypothetical protein